jgi:glycine cleavage system regulatory protein
MQDLQTQKQQLDTKMFSIQILLDEMGLSEVDSVQDAFNALACAIDEVTSDSY